MHTMFKRLRLRSSFKKKLLALTILVVAALLLVVLIQYFLSHKETPLIPPPDAPYRDATRSDAERIEDLLARMTLEEKAGQMALVEKDSIGRIDHVRRFGLGGILSGMGGKPKVNTPRDWLTMVEGYDRAARTSRLGIPVLYGVDANHGHSNVPGATIFPHAIGLGATGDASLVERIAQATNEELRATGIYWSFGPNLDLPHDIRWGRVFEAFSDDPVLAGKLGVAQIRGLAESSESPQGTRIATLATPKHYIGLGDMAWGTSINEHYSIDQGVSAADEAALRASYLPPFKAAISEGALSIMAGLNSWGDTKLSASRYLLTDVLKDELGFEGFVVSDWYAVYDITDDKYDATVIAINAGIDMIMLPFDYGTFVDDVVEAVERGDVPEARIDDAVRRILRAKFALGLFERSGREEELEVIGSSAHRTLAREAVAKSAVLLKNNYTILPLSKDTPHIRVAGSAAHDIGKQAGGWTVEWQGISGNDLKGATSILEGIKNAVGEQTRVEFDATGNFTGGMADIGIAVVGERPYAEGYGDSALPILDSEDVATIERLRTHARSVVVVLVTGRPLLIERELPTWDALVVAWLPGSEGAGVADVLFGARKFTGTLPLPWPRTLEQLPLDRHGRTADGTAVLYPRYFRFGK